MIWGIPVPRKSNGRKMWPTEIQFVVVEQVAAGKSVAELACDTTANESSMGRRVRDLRGHKVEQRQTSITKVVAVREFEEPARGVNRPVKH